MINNQERDEKKIEALRLIDLAEDLVNRGKGKEAIDLYEKAAQLYLDLGSYLKIDEIYIRIASIILKFKNHIQAVYRLKSIIRKTETLNLEEISAKLLIQLGNISFRMKDYETAGESYEKAGDYFYNLDPEEYYNLSSELLLKAALAIEKAHSDRNKGERLILRAVMIENKIEKVLGLEEKRSMQLLEMEKYEAAANKYVELSNYFQKTINNINELIINSEEIEIIKNTKSRLIHITAEYVIIALICLKASKNKENNQKIVSLGNTAIGLLKDAIILLKECFHSKMIENDKEDYLRITFDTFLISLIQSITETKKIHPLNFLLENLDDKSIVKRIKKTPYYHLIERIEKVGLLESLTNINDTHLGRLDKIKKILNL